MLGWRQISLINRSQSKFLLLLALPILVNCTGPPIDGPLNPLDPASVQQYVSLSKTGNYMQQYEALASLKRAAREHPDLKRPAVEAALAVLGPENHHVARMQSSLVLREYAYKFPQSLGNLLATLEDPNTEWDVFGFLCDAVAKFGASACGSINRIGALSELRNDHVSEPSTDPKLKILDVLGALGEHCKEQVDRFIRNLMADKNPAVREKAGKINARLVSERVY